MHNWDQGFCKQNTLEFYLKLLTCLTGQGISEERKEERKKKGRKMEKERKQASKKGNGKKER